MITSAFRKFDRLARAALVARGHRNTHTAVCRVLGVDKTVYSKYLHGQRATWSQLDAWLEVWHRAGMPRIDIERPHVEEGAASQP